MRLKASAAALLCALLGIAPARAAAAAEQITWLMPDFLLLNAPGKPRIGMSEPMAKYLIEQWPQAKHEVLHANVKRSWAMIEAGQHACHLAMLRTPERESRAYFSSTHLVPPVQLVVRKAIVSQLPRNAAGEVDLRKLLMQGNLRGALVMDRSYGAVIDAELARQPGGAVTRYAPGDFGGRLLNMLAAGRTDYSIDFDFTLLQQKSQAEPGSQELMSLPIQGVDTPMVSGIACPRNEWGRNVLKKVDQLFATPAGIEALKRNYALWLTPATQARYGARMEAFYNEKLKAAGR